MEKIDYKKVLLDIAVCAISCDGHIDQKEIDELNLIEKKSPYFSQLDLTENLQKSIDSAIKSYALFQESIFRNLDSLDLSIVQQLTILEISMILIAADKKFEESEIIFINSLRSRLSVQDFLINERFGDIEYLDKQNLSSNEFDTPNKISKK
jgi:hypothetical protein|tara:strand:+ start:2224 stop:2679 length:456 start_codon:yes stop_codon:yes gene_type:complete